MSQPKFQDGLEPIDKRIYNTHRSKGALPSLLEEDYFDQDISVTLLRLMPKIQDSQVYKRHNITSFGIKSRRI